MKCGYIKPHFLFEIWLFNTRILYVLIKYYIILYLINTYAYISTYKHIYILMVIHNIIL